MSDSAISAGDLVMVTKACCDRFVRSPVFTVAEIIRDSESFCCYGCGAVLCFSAWATDKASFGYPLPWLKKFDPPALDEATQEVQGVNIGSI